MSCSAKHLLRKINCISMREIFNDTSLRCRDRDSDRRYKAEHPAGFEPTTPWLRGKRSTVVLPPSRCSANSHRDETKLFCEFLKKYFLRLWHSGRSVDSAAGRPEFESSVTKLGKTDIWKFREKKLTGALVSLPFESLSRSNSLLRDRLWRRDAKKCVAE